MFDVYAPTSFTPPKESPSSAQQGARSDRSIVPTGGSRGGGKALERLCEQQQLQVSAQLTGKQVWQQKTES